MAVTAISANDFERSLFHTPEQQLQVEDRPPRHLSAPVTLGGDGGSGRLAVVKEPSTAALVSEAAISCAMKAHCYHAAILWFLDSAQRKIQYMMLHCARS